MADIYYQLSDGTNTLTFVMVDINISKSRDAWEMPLPYLNDPFLTDQITTTTELTINGKIKPGSGFPYATVILALAAIANLTPATYNTGWSLTGGDWTSPTFTPNALYPFAIGSGSTKLLVKMVRFSMKAGEAYSTGEIDVIITLIQGYVF